jgi:hypothetical protein
MVNASFQILKDTTDYFQNSLDIKNKNLTLLLIRYKYYNFSFFSLNVFLLPKIFVTKRKKMTGG